MPRPWSFTALAVVCASAASVFAQPPSMSYPSTGYATPPTTYRAPASPRIEPQPPAPPAASGQAEAARPQPAPLTGGNSGWMSEGGKGYGAPCGEGLDGWPCADPCTLWYGRAGASFMTRDDLDPVWLSYNTADLGDGRLFTDQASPNWGWGGDVVLGRMLGGGAYAVEVGYWGIDPSNRQADAFDPDGTVGNATDLDTVFAFDSLEYNGTAVADFYTNAFIHRLVRSYEAHNVELNLVRSPFYGSGFAYGGHHISFRWLAGIRYLKFNDGFEYMTDDANTVFDGDVNEVTYLIDIDNNFIGGQVGLGLDYRFHQVFSAYATAKTGFYGSQISHRSRISGSAGDAVVNNAASPYNGQAFNVSTSTTGVAFISELDFGFRYQFLPHWSATMGYRAVGITGVALTTDQIPLYFADIGGVRNINSDGSLILHGGYFGIEFLY